MSSGGFEIAQAHLTVSAEPDEASAHRAASSIGRTISASIAALGIGKMIGDSISKNLDMTDSRAKIQAQLNLTAGDAKRIGKLSGEVYRDGFGGSMDDVNDSIKAVGNNMGDISKMSTKDIKSISEAALGLSSTFGVDVGDSTKAAGQLMKTYGMTAGQAMDVVTSGLQNSNNKGGDWLDTLNEYAPQFQKIGLSGTQMNGLIHQAMDGNARDSDAAADSFKEFGIRVVDGSKTTDDAFTSLGFSAKDMAAKFAAGGPSAAEAMDQTTKALQGVKDPLEQNRIGTELYGSTWEDTMRKALPKINVAAAATDTVTGSTKKMNDTMGNTPTAKVEVFKRQMEGLAQKALELPGPLDTVAAGMLSLGPAGVTAVAGVTTIISNIGPMVTGIRTATVATYGWVSSMVTAAARGVASMATTVATTVAGWIVQAATAVASAATIAAAWLVAYWPIALIVAAVIGLVILIVANWDTIKRVTVELWNSVWDFTKGIWDTIVKGIKSALDFVVNLFMKWTIYGIVIKHWRDILNFITGTISSVKSTVSSGLNWVKSKVDAILGATANVFSSQLGRAKGYVSGAFSYIRSTVSGAITGARNAVTGAVGKITGAVGTIKSKAKSALSGLGSLLYDSGRSLISGFISGIMSKLGDVGGAAKSIVSKAKNFFPFSPAKEGPLSGDGYTDVSGAALVTDFAGGMLSAAPTVRSAAASTLQGVQSAFSAPAATGTTLTAPRVAAPAVHLTLNVNSLTMPSKEEMDRFAAEAAASIKEAIRLHDRAEKGSR